MKTERNKSQWGKKGEGWELKGSLRASGVQGRTGKEMRQKRENEMRIKRNKEVGKRQKWEIIKKCEQESVKLWKEKQRDGQRPYCHVCCVRCVWCCTNNVYNKVPQMGKSWFPAAVHWVPAGETLGATLAGSVVYWSRAAPTERNSRCWGPNIHAVCILRGCATAYFCLGTECLPAMDAFLVCSSARLAVPFQPKGIQLLWCVAARTLWARPWWVGVMGRLSRKRASLQTAALA